MKRGKNKSINAFLTVLTVFITVIILIPFIWLVILSFKTNSQIMNEPFALPETFSLENYRTAFDVLPLFSMYKNTFINEKSNV